jgi:hypothetical protein
VAEHPRAILPAGRDVEIHLSLYLLVLCYSID